jgi:hypothetical protein
MKTAFTVLEKHGKLYAATAKVFMLCNIIQMEANQQVQISKSQMMDMHADNGHRDLPRGIRYGCMP